MSTLSLLLLVPLTLWVGYTLVQVTQPLTLPRGDRPPVLTAAETGTHLPVIGVGPLVRVLAITRHGGEVSAHEPFTGAPVDLTPVEQRASGGSRYVIERYGYSATARRTISLTFDDGPDPVWTRKLLDILAREHVPATFFLIGEHAAANPDLVRRMVREGFAIGNHTTTHADLNSVHGWMAQDQIVMTDHVLRTISHQATRALRLPYGGEDLGSLRDSVQGILRAQRLGYVLAEYDFDTQDWLHAAQPGLGPIPLPTFDGRNITVLMHDGGGVNRQLTLDYVQHRLIPAARAAGYTFQTMPQVDPALRATTEQVNPTFSDRMALDFVWLFAIWPNRILRVLFWLAVVTVAGVGALSVALAWSRHRSRPSYADRTPAVLPVSVVVAAYNEQEVIRRTLRALGSSRYPLLEVVVVDDGSTDATAREVEAAMAQDDRVRLVRQPNAGKWRALNAGFAEARGDIVVTFDADTVFTEHTVAHLVRQFGLPHGHRLAAVAGVVRVGNRRENLLTRWQALEYLTQIGVERAAFAKLGAIPIVPGACAAWRRTAVLDVGGYAPATLAEDCDLTLSLHEAGWQVSQDDDAIAYTEAPDHVDALLAQRIRWTFGTLQALSKHRGMMFSRRHGMLGAAVLPYMALSTALPILFLPLVVTMAFIAVQVQGWWVVGFYFGVFTLVHAFIAAAGCVLMREKWSHLLVVPVYRLMYEPMRAYLLYTSAYLAVRGVRMGWNKLQRTGALDDTLLFATRRAPSGTTEVRP